MTALFLFLFGCPLPPEENAANNNVGNRNPNMQNQQNNTPNQNKNNIGTPPTPGAGGQQNPGQVRGAAGGAPGGAPGGVLHDLSQLKEQKTQEEISRTHVLIRGNISGECNDATDVLLTDSSADAQPKDHLPEKIYRQGSL